MSATSAVTSGSTILDVGIVVVLAVVAFKLLKVVFKLTENAGMVIDKTGQVVGSTIDAVNPKHDQQTEQDTAVGANTDSGKVNAVKFLVPAYGFGVVAKKYKNLNDYYLNVKHFSSVTADNIAHNIYDSKGNINDDEDAVYASFTSIPSLACLSLVANRFLMLYPGNGGLLNYLTTFLNGEELDIIYEIIKKKPVL